MSPQVVQNQKISRANLVKTVVVGHGALRTIGAAQVVEQIRGDHKQSRLSSVNNVVGNGRSQVSFATPIAAQQNQPTLRLLGKFQGGLIGHAQILAPFFGQANAIRHKGIKGKANHRLHITDGAQVTQAFFFLLMQLALAFDQFAKVGLADRHILAQPACSAANGTQPLLFVWRRAVITALAGMASRRLGVGRRLLFQNVV